MRHNDWFPKLAVLIVIAIMVSGLVYFVKAKNDCNDKGGHLAKDAISGLYHCYGEEK